MLLALTLLACKGSNPPDNPGSGAIEDCPTRRWYPDGDGDGWGQDIVGTSACEAPLDYVDRGGDCDDEAAGIHPEATERCDAVDEDCDGHVDESLPTRVAFVDADGDSYGDEPVVVCALGPGLAEIAGDCDDTEASAYPEAPEICDSLDNDCDGLVDISDPSLTEIYSWYPDGDSDRFGSPNRMIYACFAPPGYVGNDTDCDDNNSSVNPWATELCYDGVDQDCDGRTDDYTGACFVVPDGDDLCAGSIAPVDLALCGQGVAAVLSDGAQFNTVQAAVDAARAGEVISVCPGRFVENLTVGVSPLSIVGFGPDRSQLDGQGGGTLQLPDGGTFSVVNLGFENGGGASGGAIVGRDLHLCLTRVALGFHAVSGDGGAVSLLGSGELVVDECVFSNNAAGRSGGALSAAGDYATQIEDSIFATNEAAVQGGALNLSGSVWIRDSRVIGNLAGVGGGASWEGELGSFDTDWGAGTTDNGPQDLYSLVAGYSYSYGLASFDCASDGVCQ